MSTPPPSGNEFRCHAKSSEDGESVRLSFELAGKQHHIELPTPAAIAVASVLCQVTSFSPNTPSPAQLEFLHKCKHLLGAFLAQQGGFIRLEEDYVNEDLGGVEIHSGVTYDGQGLNVWLHRQYPICPDCKKPHPVGKHFGKQGDGGKGHE